MAIHKVITCDWCPREAKLSKDTLNWFLLFVRPKAGLFFVTMGGGFTVPPQETPTQHVCDECAKRYFAHFLEVMQ